jgi:hypothetical protein
VTCQQKDTRHPLEQQSLSKVNHPDPRSRTQRCKPRHCIPWPPPL